MDHFPTLSFLPKKVLEIEKDYSTDASVLGGNSGRARSLCTQKGGGVYDKTFGSRIQKNKIPSKYIILFLFLFRFMAY